MNSPIVQRFEEFLQANLPEVKSFHPYYNDALKHVFKAGGKRFRPYLLLTLVNHYEQELLENSFFIASGLEMLHTYSLIHDDLPSMDNSKLRRGMNTLHVKYDEVTAILIGDALNTHAFYMLANAPLDENVKIKLIKSLSLNGGIEGMVLGQALDCYFENKKLSFEQLKFLHTNKTAKLIASALQMGAIISNLSEKEVQDWYNFGIELGILFQIQDDIIDIKCSEFEAGKPTHNDTNKNTYVSILGLDEAVKQKENILQNLRQKLKEFPTPLQENFNSMLNKYFRF